MPYDKIEPAHQVVIERTVFDTFTPEEIEPFVRFSKGVLMYMRGESIAAEKSIFEKLREVAQEWEEQAKRTSLYQHALDYLNAGEVEHSANQWVEEESGVHRRSNRVYQMFYETHCHTKYDWETNQMVPKYWTIKWYIALNTSVRDRYRTIAGQERKRFDDREKMDKYIAGRIKAYDNLFTEINPPIPPEYADCFKVNGILLPGYTIQTV